MALYVENGIIKNNDKRWKTYRILNDELTQVYKLKKDNDDNLYLEETSKTEKNDELEDIATGVNYFFAIRDGDPDDNIYEATLYLDTFDCVDMCETIHKNSDDLAEIKSILVDMNLENSMEQLEVTTNGWKLI